MGASIIVHFRRLEGLVGPTKIEDVTKLPAIMDKVASNTRAHRKGFPRFYYPEAWWYALHAVQLSYNQLWASQRVLSAQVHHVRWDEWSIRPSTILLVVNDIGHWKQCTTLQSLSNQPPWFNHLIVSLAPLKLHQFFSRCLWGIWWPLLMFRTSKAEYKDLVEH